MQAAQALERGLSGDLAMTWADWWARYRVELQRLLRAVRIACARKSQRASTAIAARLDPFLPPSVREQPLSRKALACLVNTPGVTAVLNGMRTPAYVDDSLAVLGWPSFAASADLFRAFA